ncbi:MAG TPA: hypothetical protein DDX85_04525 [Nitrospiraceae bacterium]|nr:hypothetical protein [Nitrospiraceae bacterium]
MKRSLGIILFLLVAAFSLSLFFAAIPSTRLVIQDVYAQEWKDEFDDICGKTQNAMNLSPDELKSLIDRCNKLRARIEQLEESQKKVYLKRLSLCQDLFSFVLQSKENQ